MRRHRRLTKVEWEIMEGVWKLGVRVIAREVHHHLYPRGQKAFSTVQTILNILAQKGFLQKEKIGRINFFTPLVSREEMGQREVLWLVSRVYHGAFGSLASYLMDIGTFSEKELKLLKEQVDGKARGKRAVRLP